ncbi:helix-turn-helix domain-containing protein [Enterococcus italicus]|uniref:helix-turn-helix domain-containing protein n=1 Tax=Enterococcus italicus TaxID=246144 RepID=UPI003FA326C0
MKKLLYGEITDLSDDKGECVATNKYLSELLGVSKATISKGITNLVDFGYIERLMIIKDSTKEIDHRILKAKTYHAS